MEEIWKDIPEFEGQFQVSNLGNVKRGKTLNDKGELVFYDTIAKYTKYTSRYGHYVKLPFNNSIARRNVADLVARAFVDNPNNYEAIVFKDGNCFNDVSTNLKWVKTRFTFNSACGVFCTSITPEDLIKKLILQYPGAIAKEFGMSSVTFRNRMRVLGITGTRKEIFEKYNGLEILNSVSEDEQWKYIDGYDNYYLVSNKGQVRHLFGSDTNSLMEIEPHLKRISLKIGKSVRKVSIANLVAKAFIPNPMNLQYVQFKDGDSYNFDASNLTWSDKPHRAKKGDFSLVEVPPMLTLINQLRIMTDEAIAEKYGVDVRTVLKWCTVYCIPRNFKDREKYLSEYA